MNRTYDALLEVLLELGWEDGSAVADASAVSVSLAKHGYELCRSPYDSAGSSEDDPPRRLTASRPTFDPIDEAPDSHWEALGRTAVGPDLERERAKGGGAP